MLIGYGRISKGEDQDDTLQVKALKAAGCKRIYSEAASGGRWDRPELHRMLDQLRDGDIVVVWKLDRLTRLLKDLLLIISNNSPPPEVVIMTPFSRMTPRSGRIRCIFKYCTRRPALSRLVLLSIISTYTAITSTD